MLEKYITKNGKKLRLGFTTGTSAALAAKASTMMLTTGKKNDTVNLLTPSGIDIETEVFDQEIADDYAVCSVIKDAGDDPDVTDGIKIFAKVKINYSNEIRVIGGIGIGTVTKKGLSVIIGEKAINPVPKKMIIDAVRSVSSCSGFDVEIFIPQGEEIAKKTFNEKLGVVGGISIIGTTGIVKPMSEEAIIESLFLELNILREVSDEVVLVFGNYGEKFAVETLGIEKNLIVNMSNFCGEMLKKANELGFKKITLIGHIGKILKLAGGIFNTHSKYADARTEILSSHYGYYSGNIEALKNIFESNTSEEACEYIKDKNFYSYFSDVIKKKCREYVGNEKMDLKIIIFSQEKGLLGESK